MVIVKYGMVAAFRKYLSAVFKQIPLHLVDSGIVKLQYGSSANRKFLLNIDKVRMLKDRETTNGVYYVDSAEEAEYYFGKTIEELTSNLQEEITVLYPLQSICSRVRSVVYRDWGDRGNIPADTTVKTMLRRMVSDHVYNVTLDRTYTIEDDDALMMKYLFHGSIMRLVELHNTEKIRLIVLHPESITSPVKLQQLFTAIGIAWDVPVLQPHQTGMPLRKTISSMKDTIFDATMSEYGAFIEQQELYIQKLLSDNNILVI
jgi:hypothetical protein